MKLRAQAIVDTPAQEVAAVGAHGGHETWDSE